MQKLLNPCADPTFKALFTDNSDEAREALQAFLSALIGKTVTDIHLEPNELSTESITDKQSEFDLNCKIDDEFVNIEMQGRNEDEAFDMRAEYNAAHLLNHYVTKGMSWINVPRIYQISVLNFHYNEKDKSGFNHYKLRNEIGNTIESERLNVIFLELPKFKEIADDIKKLTVVEKWAKFFLYANNPKKQDFVKELCKAEAGIMKAKAVLDRISQDEIAWQKEQSYFRFLSDVATAKECAEKRGWENGVNRGMKEGLEMGMKEGLERGMQQGIEQGIEQGIQQGIEQGIQQGIEQGLQQGLEQGIEKQKHEDEEIINRYASEIEKLRKEIEHLRNSK